MEIKDFYSGLSDEQKQKLKDCKDVKEMMQLFNEEGVKLTDDQLDDVSGGMDSRDYRPRIIINH